MSLWVNCKLKVGVISKIWLVFDCGFGIYVDAREYAKLAVFSCYCYSITNKKIISNNGNYPKTINFELNWVLMSIKLEKCANRSYHIWSLFLLLWWNTQLMSPLSIDSIVWWRLSVGLLIDLPIGIRGYCSKEMGISLKCSLLKGISQSNIYIY